jgi:predicted Zn-dependent protease
MGKSAATNGVATIGSTVASVFFGVSPQITDLVAKQGANLLNLKFSRDDETEADLVGMEIAARAGVTLWQKMSAANKGAPPQWLSTHPSGTSRIEEIQANLPKVLPLYERAK